MKNLVILLFILSGFNLNAQNTILWKVSHPNTDKTSYLLGTLHQLGNSFVDSLPLIEESLLQSDLIILESIDGNEKLIAKMNSRKASNKINSILNKKELQQLKELSKDWSVELTKLSPAEIYMKLSQELPKVKCNTVKPTDSWSHFDNYLQNIATENNKRILGLESDSLQLAVINQETTPTTKEQKKALKGILKTFRTTKVDDNICRLVNEYRSFKIDYEFESLCAENMQLKGRNNNWMMILPDQLKNQNCFVAVGLAHLMRNCGLIEQLRIKGFVITPIKLN